MYFENPWGGQFGFGGSEGPEGVNRPGSEAGGAAAEALRILQGFLADLPPRK